jgi:aryl-phospho-beta-D-glucosidase BglC (GH1 family)
MIGNSRQFQWIIAILLAVSSVSFGQTNLPVAEQKVLFTSGSPHPWAIRSGGFSGGQSQVTQPQANLLITATKPNSGGGLNYSTHQRFDPLPYLNDATMRIELAFRITSETSPKRLSMVLRTATKKQIQSKQVKLDEAQSNKEGWQVLRFAFADFDQITAEDLISGVMVTADTPCQITIESIILKQYRNVSLSVTNDPLTNMKSLKIQGQTRDPQAKVFIKLFNADGKFHLRTVESQQGTYSMTWDNPPLSEQQHNKLTAKIGNGEDPMDHAIDADVFGYQTDTQHIWLKVKGSHIVTSEKSREGEKPFIATGVGYARNVIMAAQDEEVASFCKSMHLNTIRLPFYLRFFNNRETEPIDLEYHLRTFVDPVIQAAKRHGLYVILDSHGYFSGQVDEARARQTQKNVNRWNEEGVSEWVNRWQQVAAYYKDEPYVLGYELCNEPHDIEPQTVRDWYGRARAAIRQVDPRHIIIVGNCDWSHSRSLEKTWGGFTESFDAPYNNTVYAFHDYPTDNHPWIVQEHITAFRDKHNVPVMCTEFGASWWDHDETTCREFESGMLGLFAKENVGWMVWALKTVINNPRHPHPLPKKIADQLPKDQQPRQFDSCAYSDIWGPIARIMGSPMPEPAMETARGE